MTDNVLGMFNVDAEIERFQPGDTASGRRAETLIKTEGLRVVLVTMRSGITLHEHVAPGPITIHALRGRFTAAFEGEKRELGPGDVLSLAAGVRHAVEALAEGAFLLTIGWGPGARSE
jgi:quercetin dioxygenase-like cupin family protein